MHFIKASDGIYYRVDSQSVVAWDAWGPSGSGTLQWEFRIGSTAIEKYATEGEAQAAVDQAVEAVGDVYEL